MRNNRNEGNRGDHPFKNDKLIVEKGHYFNKEYAKNLNIYVDYSTEIGDEITIKNGDDTKTYSIAIKGDTSGDANINIADLLKVQKHI